VIGASRAVAGPALHHAPPALDEFDPTVDRSTFQENRAKRSDLVAFAAQV
jgi:hypothetical protein